MPELPEVETIRRGLSPLIGSRITKASVFRERSVRMHDGGSVAFSGDLPGFVISAAVRRGKFLWLPLHDAGAPGFREPQPAAVAALLIHLGMSGQLRLNSSTALTDTEKHPHLRVQLELQLPDGEPGLLDFIDQRTFGHIAVVDLVPTADGLPGGQGDLLAALPKPAAHIARDVLDPHLDLASVKAKISKKNTEIKRVLLDQTVLSGIGNIYADEALWQAKINPQTRASALTDAQIQSLIQAAAQIVTKSLAVGGTSFDALYVNVNGESGNNSSNLKVYGKESEPCPRCGTSIERITFMNRSSHYCPVCQR